MLQTGKVVSLIPDEVIGFFNSPYPSSRTMALGSTQPLNRNEYQESSCCGGGGGEEWPASKADKLTAIRVPTV
jgi:hypothetical protein